MKFLFIALVALLLLSCGQKSKDRVFDVTLNEPKLEEKAFLQNERPEIDTTKPVSVSNQNGSSKNIEQTKVDWDKKIVKTGSLNVEVKNYNDFNSSLRQKIKQFGGYISQEEQSQTDYSIQNSAVIKIPVDQFDDAVSAFTNGVEKINEKKISSEDVTTEVVDTKSRMESKKQVRQRYLDLLKQAKNMDEILNVQNEINSTQEEIESAAGRIEYLTHSSTFSTINLTYSQILNATAQNPNNRPSFGIRFANAFKDGLHWVSELFIGLISIWPLMFLGAALFFVYKKIRIVKPKQG